jgi:hypothetical protein
MPTLEELYARFQMEEKFQKDERSLDQSDSEEALVIQIQNVTRRCFSQNPQSFGSHQHI